MITFDFPAVLAEWPLLLKGLAWTLGLTLVATPLGLLIATLGAWSRANGPAWLRRLLGVYVELLRNTPFIVQLFFIFFGLPSLNIHISEITAAILAMVINLGAYSTEIIRAGVQAIPRGQIEAAQSLSMSRGQIFRHIILRPALQKIWPALSSQVVIVMLGSAVCSQIAVEELSFAANYIQGRNFRAFEAYIVATAIYLVLAILLRQLLRLIGNHFITARRTA